MKESILHNEYNFNLNEEQKILLENLFETLEKYREDSVDLSAIKIILLKLKNFQTDLIEKPIFSNGDEDRYLIDYFPETILAKDPEIREILLKKDASTLEVDGSDITSNKNYNDIIDDTMANFAANIEHLHAISNNKKEYYSILARKICIGVVGSIIGGLAASTATTDLKDKFPEELKEAVDVLILICAAVASGLAAARYFAKPNNKEQQQESINDQDLGANILKKDVSKRSSISTQSLNQSYLNLPMASQTYTPLKKSSSDPGLNNNHKNLPHFNSTISLQTINEDNEPNTETIMMTPESVRNVKSSSSSKRSAESSVVIDIQTSNLSPKTFAERVTSKLENQNSRLSPNSLLRTIKQANSFVNAINRSSSNNSTEIQSISRI